MKYIKKSAMIESFQYDGDFMNKDGKYYIPEWAVKAHKNGILTFASKDDNEPPINLYITNKGQ